MKAGKKETCPVCGMLVSRKTHFTAAFKGKRYYFCCEECKSAFLNSPYTYLV